MTTTRRLTILLSLSPNRNAWYIAGQFNRENRLNQRALPTMLEPNKKICPACIDVENNVVVMRVNLRGVDLTSAELMDELKAFYGAGQRTRIMCAATPANSRPSSNRFGRNGTPIEKRG